MQSQLLGQTPSEMKTKKLTNEIKEKLKNEKCI